MTKFAMCSNTSSTDDERWTGTVPLVCTLTAHFCEGLIGVSGFPAKLEMSDHKQNDTPRSLEAKVQFQRDENHMSVHLHEIHVSFMLAPSFIVVTFIICLINTLILANG